MKLQCKTGLKGLQEGGIGGFLRGLFGGLAKGTST